MFGLKFRNTLTPRQDLTNDITASSEFNVNGKVKVNNIGVDPNSGLVTLPVNLSDPSQQIAKNCGSNQGSSLVVTGRGGIPHDPSQKTVSDRPWSDLRPIPSSKIAIQPAPAQRLLEATHWTKDAHTGQITILAAQTTTATAIATCAVSIPSS